VREDFFSYQRLGKPIPKNPEQQRRWRGISTYDTLERARAIARANPAQGDFIAEIAIPDDGRITYERTGKNPGHYTLWGEPDDMVRCVTRIEPVNPRNEDRVHGDDVPTLG
jgi:hypothetical protein